MTARLRAGRSPVPRRTGRRPGRHRHPPPGLAALTRITLRTLGEILLTFGVVVLLFAGYEVWGKVGIIHDHQNDLDNQLAQAWGGPVAASPGPSVSPSPSRAPVPGGAIARLYIPKLHLHWVVVEGVTLRDIRYAPGHYPGTALPGQLGNFAVAGHRERGMFWDLDRIGPGDLVVAETRHNWFVYRVYQNEIVSPRSVGVIAPTPDRPGVAPTDADITLTTCDPKWDNYQRMVVHGKLIQTTPHDRPPPVALGD